VLAEKDRMREAAIQRLIEERDDIELNLTRYKQGAKKETETAFKDLLEKYQAKKIELDRRIAELLEQKEELRRAEEKKRASLFQWQKNYSAIVEEKNHINGLLQAVKIELTQLEMRREQLGFEAREEMGDEPVNEIIEQASAGNIKPVSKEDTRSLRAEIKRLGQEAASLGEVDDEILCEYEDVKKRFDFLSNQTEDLDGAITTLTKICNKLERKITSQFGERFNHLNTSFGKFVHTLFQGGSGALEKIALDDGEIGIEIIVEPPGKKIKHTGVLSGGERSLVGVALICAIISSNPPPFVILDEIDAALDEANTARLVKIMKELSAHTQFIIITHNRATMEIADVLYGVTMGNDGVSRIVGVKLEKYG
jgi:chromosome segregation protein